MIAATAAWHLAEMRQRRVMLLDLDLNFGDAALQFDAAPSHALCEALQHPDRVDDLFLERGVIKITDRLNLLATLEPIGKTEAPNEAAVLSLLETLLHRYRYVFVDLPAVIAPNLMRVLHLPGTLLLVGTGSLVSARDIARWSDAVGASSAERTVFRILNKSGAHDCLRDQEFIRAAGHVPDMVIPYNRDIGLASNMGIRAVYQSASLRRELAPLLQQLGGEAEGNARLSLLQRMFRRTK
jgi:pilus assembly protein CpaE